VRSIGGTASRSENRAALLFFSLSSADRHAEGLARFDYRGAGGSLFSSLSSFSWKSSSPYPPRPRSRPSIASPDRKQYFEEPPCVCQASLPLLLSLFFSTRSFSFFFFFPALLSKKNNTRSRARSWAAGVPPSSPLSFFFFFFFSGAPSFSGRDQLGAEPSLYFFCVFPDPAFAVARTYSLSTGMPADFFPFFPFFFFFPRFFFFPPLFPYSARARRLLVGRDPTRERNIPLPFLFFFLPPLILLFFSLVKMHLKRRVKKK